jgi:TorA maturation chaperone TorD
VITQDGPAPSIPDELLWRANTYALLARLIAAPPDVELLGRLSSLPAEPAGADTPALARAWGQLSEAARHTAAGQAAREHRRLFVGISEAELMPYASWYLTGLLMEKPLADLRSDLAELGITRQVSFSEPEDHAAAVLESMCLLIEADDPRQQGFFARHVATWMPRFFRDLEAAPGAGFYKAVGILGPSFMALEREYAGLCGNGLARDPF